jgi:hypothetical protein
MSIDKLCGLVEPPKAASHAPASETWNVIEGQIGVGLPRELKAFCSKYGIGSFRAEESPALNIWCPGEGPKFVDELRAECKRYLDARGENRSDDFPYNVFPEAGGLLPLGSDDNDVWLCWVTNGPADTWQIAVRWTWGINGLRTFNLTLCQFLVSLFKREIELPCWPSPMFEEHLHFVPYEGPI